jgi:N-acetylmuramoyl-L-alanine amidase
MRKYLLLSISLCLMVLTACQKEDKVDKIEEDEKIIPPVVIEKEKQSVALKRMNFDYSIMDLIPDNLLNYSNGEESTPLSSQIMNEIEQLQILIDELQSVYNNAIEQVTFYDDFSTSVSNSNVEIKNVKYNGYLVLTDIQMNISSDATSLPLEHFFLNGKFELEFTRSLNDNFYYDIMISVKPEQANEQLIIKISENESFDVYLKQTDENNQSIEFKLQLNYQVQNKKTEINGYKHITSEESNQIQKHNYHSIITLNEGVIYHQELVMDKDENQTLSRLEDVEVFANEIGLVYKSLINGKNQGLYQGFVGWPSQAITNYEYENQGTSDHLVQYGTKKGLVSLTGSAGISTKNINLYDNDSYDLEGYFIDIDQEITDLYKYVFDLSMSEMSVSQDLKLRTMEKVSNLYRNLLINSGIEINREERLDILEVNIEKQFNDYQVTAGYDENQNYQISILSPNESYDFIYLDGLFYHINNITFNHGEYIAYGQKEGKAYTLIFKINDEGKIIEDSVFEYNHRRLGQFTNFTYDLSKNEYHYNLTLVSGENEVISLLGYNDMMPYITKHISLNHSHGNYIKPEYIVIHETGTPQIGADALYWAYHWNRDENAKASTQYAVDETTVVQFMDVDFEKKLVERAWHVGDNKGYSTIYNSNTIGIEICVNEDGNYDKARQNAIELTIYLMKEFDLTPEDIVRHKDASGKYCPRYMLDHPELWLDFKEQVKLAYDSWQ